MVTLAWNGNVDIWLREILMFMYFFLFLAKKETSNRNLLGYWERGGNLSVNELQFLHKK